MYICNCIFITLILLLLIAGQFRGNVSYDTINYVAVWTDLGQGCSGFC